jgi:hypothetical protein
MSEAAIPFQDFRQFSILPAIDGFDVIDNATGHAVDHRDERRVAAGVAWKLNNAAAAGGDYLTQALHAGSERVTRV